MPKLLAECTERRGSEPQGRLTVLHLAQPVTGGVARVVTDLPDHGIETLIVFLGANNALSSVVDLKVVWSEAGYDDLRRKGRFTVWRPEHFAAELGQLAQAVERIRARHVIWQSCAVFQTGLSYPAIIAHELGWSAHFRQPSYDGAGGLPLNLEMLLRELEEHCGKDIDWWETPAALFRARRFMDKVEDHWERGAGAAPVSTTAINHNLAVFGWDLRDALEG